MMDADGKECQIERDDEGWHGYSDLHLCYCAPANMFLTSPSSMSLHLSTSTKLFRTDYGAQLAS
jgi:hypothetical protein